MSRKRKPVLKPISAATDALMWRARIVCEMLDGLEMPAQLHEPIKRMKEALEDFEASKFGGGGANGHAPHQVAKSEQLELQP